MAIRSLGVTPEQYLSSSPLEKIGVRSLGQAQRCTQSPLALFDVAVGQIAEDLKIDVVLCEGLTVLPKAKLLRASHNLPQRSAPWISWRFERLLDQDREPRRSSISARAGSSLDHAGARRGAAYRGAAYPGAAWRGGYYPGAAVGAAAVGAATVGAAAGSYGYYNNGCYRNAAGYLVCPNQY